MLVIINGMQRSGSTLCFNIVREILEVKQLGSVEARRTASIGRISFLDELIEQLAQDNRWGVTKAHYLDPIVLKRFGEGYAKALFTFRHPSDICASWARLTKDPNATEDDWTRNVRLDVSFYFTQKNNPDVKMLKYEDFYDKHEELIIDISKFLNVPLNSEELRIVVENTSLDKAKQVISTLPNSNHADPKTELRGNHVSEENGRPGSYRHLLSKRTEELIRVELGDYMKDAGYVD